GSDRVTQGHRTAVHVYFLLVPTEDFPVGQGDGGEGFVHFEQIDVIDGQIVFFQELFHRIGRSDREIAGLHPHGGVSENARHRPYAQLFRFLGGGEHQGRRPVVHPRSVAGGNRSVLQENRGKGCQLFQTRVPAGGFVLIHHHLFLAGLHRHRDDLFRQLAGIDGGDGPPVTAQGPLVLLFPAHRVLGRHIASVHHHVHPVKGAPQPVVDHQVDELPVPHPLPPASAGNDIGGVAHALHPAGHHHVRIAGARSEEHTSEL